MLGREMDVLKLYVVTEMTTFSYAHTYIYMNVYIHTCEFLCEILLHSYIVVHEI